MKMTYSKKKRQKAVPLSELYYSDRAASVVQRVFGLVVSKKRMA